MLQPSLIYFALPSLVFANSLSQTTITPDADNLVAGSWTVSVALPLPTTVEVLIETLFNQFNSITLVGPTTFTSLVRDRSADSVTATGGTEAALTINTASGATSRESATTSGAGSVSTGNGAASHTQSGGSETADSSPSSTLAAPPSVGTQNQPHYGMDPDSAMAVNLDKMYSNVTYTPPAYVPTKIAPDVCILWDPNCNGNKTLAAEQFFGQSKANSSGTMLDLLVDPCFNGHETDASGTNCTSSLLNPASASFSSAAKTYMREPQCSKDYESIQPVSSRVWENCCGTCYIYGPNVDVYYWPDPSADTSCLSIIGSDVVPLNGGAQTDGAGIVYWAASTNLYDIYVPTVTTAIITTINGIVVKEAVKNPWDASPSITTTRPVSNMMKRNHLSVHPRAFNPLYGRELGTGGNSSLGTGVTASARASELTGSTAVSGDFTFTSPSIYVAFYSLSATDACGLRGDKIESTMLAFAPGELSTVQGHLWSGGVQHQKTKVFDFADLPCPPYDVMYDDWYKPAPGEPYRPLIALPEKVRDLNLDWGACTDAYYFTGLDPPRTLQRAVAMVTPASPAANHDPTITPDPVQPVPPLPVKTDAKQPAKATGDPVENKNLVPPPEAVPSSSGGASDPSPLDGVPPTSTPEVYPQKGDPSKAPAEPPAVDSGTDNVAHPPAAPQQNGGDSKQGTDPKANDSGPSDSSAAKPATSSTTDQQSGHEADPNQISPEKQSQLDDAGPSPAPNANPNPAPANSNSQGPENVNPVPQPQPNDNTPSQSGESNVGTTTTHLGAFNTQPSSFEASPILNIPGGLTLTQAPNDANAYVVAGTTLLPGSPAAIVSGTSYSLASSGALVVGTSTMPLATAGAVAGQIIAPNALWAGKVPFTPLPGGSAIVGSSTLSLPGPAITSSGSVLSLASGGLVVGSSTYAFATPASKPTASLTTQEVPITTALVVAGQSFTANPSGFSINGTTISAGGPGVTLNGTPVSLDRGGSLAVGTSTVALESTSIGPAATSIVAFEGSTVRRKPRCWIPVAGCVASILRWLL